MFKITVILLALLLPFMAGSQTVKTSLSKQFVIAGESFTISYILEDFKDEDEFIAPSFKGFKVISGPYTYNGTTTSRDGTKPIKNIQFTLEALYPGKFIIDGPSARVNNRLIKSPHVVVDVLSKQETPGKGSQEINSEYFLRPGEDPYEKIRKNLFMKVLVNKKTCFVGEPVVAIYKLYSRLTSKSDIVKNPGFYGFTVQDIISLSDNIASTEIVDGRVFDVHTVRAVQLYPLQAGEFAIDPMEIKNKVEFSKSAVNKKSEQEIVEGVFEEKESPRSGNVVVYENNISTEKITIHVSPLPLLKKPAGFNGATGRFSIRTSLEKPEIARNEEGAFIITVSGKGNFTQLSAPAVEWPNGIETFEPIIKDSLDKTQAPLRGSRSFRFPFISSQPGTYTFPSVSFSFFDPDSNRYKTISSQPAKVVVSNTEKKELLKDEPATGNTRQRDYKSLWIYGGIFLVVLAIILLQLTRPKKEAPVKNMDVGKEPAVSIDQLLQPARFALVA
ncbi:MAG TPA: BatD family protein, partial [Chitinophagaceae bacterium]|nr:BatD family protein [Chitinophagaceae bacterium]